MSFHKRLGIYLCKCVTTNLTLDWHHMAVRRLKSKAIRRVVCQVVKANKRENIKTLHYWTFVGLTQRWPVDSLHKWPVIQTVRPCHCIIMNDLIIFAHCTHFHLCKHICYTHQTNLLWLISNYKHCDSFIYDLMTHCYILLYHCSPGAGTFSLLNVKRQRHINWILTHHPMQSQLRCIFHGQTDLGREANCNPSCLFDI